jgi:beta-xylosidase
MCALRLSLLLALVATSLALYAQTSPSTRAQLSQLLPLEVEGSASRLGASALSVYQNPVLDRNFPDPFVMEVDHVFYSYATNSNRSNVPVARSDDLTEWTPLPDAMPELASWVQPIPNMVWAPEVIRIDDGFRMYYVAHDRESGRQCVGVASGKSPEGPFRDAAARPLICPAGFERAIDPNPYRDGNQLYVYFSGVCCGQSNGIYAQKLSPDGLTTTGEPALVIKVDTAWEGSVVEAPTMLKYGKSYYLFYSGNDYRNQTYAVGYAVCKSALGPCTKARENPLLATGSTMSGAIGPGHQSIIKVGRDYWMLYHGWNGVVGYGNGGKRALWLQPLGWRDGKPVMGAALASTGR